jgi:hypothetical protein
MAGRGGPTGSRASHRRAHHLDLAGQNGEPAGAASIPPAQQPAKITIYRGVLGQKYRFRPSVRAVWPVEN